MTKLPLSIVIPTYNDSNFLPKCLNSIRKQSYLPEKIIVVDDGSHDDAAMRICDKEKDDLLDIVYLKIKNSGPSRARNEGFNIVTSKYVLFMDVDDLLEKNALKIFADNLDKKGKEYFGVCGRIFNKRGFFFERTRYVIEEDIDFQKIGRKGSLQGQISSYLLLSDAVRQAGGFNENLRHYEDFHLILKLSKMMKLSTVDHFSLKKIDRKDSQSNKNYKKSFLGSLKFLSLAKDETLLDLSEIRSRKKETYLSYAKSLFKNLKLKETRISLEHAFLFASFNRRKEFIAFYFLKLLKRLNYRKQARSIKNTIGVIIPTHNDEVFLYEALDSILNQSLLPNELIVIDDGSNYNYLDNVKSFVSLRSRGLTLITKRIDNSGPSKARNIGASLSQSKYLLFLDSDDMLERDAILNIKRSININKLAPLLHGGIRFTSNIFRTYLPKIKYTPKDRDLIGKNKVLEGLSSFIFLREQFIEKGGFDESLSHNEDFDLVLRYLKDDIEIATLFFEIPIIRKRKGSLSNINALKSFNGVNKFLDKAKIYNLLSNGEIQTRRKESLLTLAKNDFYKFNIGSFTLNIDKAFKINAPKGFKENLVNSYLILVKIFGFWVKN